MPVDYELVEDSLRIKAFNWAIPPSIEDSEAAMAIVIDKLLEVKEVMRVVFVEAREIEYDYEQTKLLKEIANVFNRILNELKILQPKNMGICRRHVIQRFKEMQFVVLELLRKDPIGAYIRIKRNIEKVEMEMKNQTEVEKRCSMRYLENSLKPIEKILETTRLIQLAKPKLHLYLPGNRQIYREIFIPVIRPNFMLTRFVLIPPANSKLVERYYVPGNTLVEIYQPPESVRYVYYVFPREFQLSEEKYLILDAARRYLAGHKPTETEMVEPEKAREVFFNVGKDLVTDIARRMNVRLTAEELRELATILTRYTAGFGVLEILLADKRIQDVYINAPVGLSPIYINHADYEECETNLIPTKADAESWATRFRLYSGRPLDEANPVLDTDITVPGGRARVAAITRALSPTGLAYAFRRHRESPWTFPLFMKVKFFNALYAGLMSFVIDGGRAIMIAGGRSSGKSSLLGAMILEIMRKLRIIVQEDTPELPVGLYRRLGYDIIHLKSRSVITQIEAEMPAEEALRTALRLGDSVLIVGEVRSRESTVLFEAMRIGALANVVAGTIHGESAYGVFDRVVHDLGVTPTSFKALDLITIANLLKTPDGLHRFRRVVELTEVRKRWKEDPLEEGGFVQLMQYSAKEDKLKPTETLLNGESEVLNEIAKRVREWHGSWDAVWENILLRAKIKQTTVDYARDLNRQDILEAKFTVESNEAFHLFSSQSLQEVGAVDPKFVYEKWLNWFKEKIK